MPKRNPYADEAAAQTLVRYGPETSALVALLRDAEDRRDTSLRQAKTGRQFTVGAVDQAAPAITNAYRGAAQAVTPAFAQGGGIEATALGARMGEAQALAQSQLAARRVSAFEGEGAARTQALRDFSSDKGKIGQRAQDIARESGAFSAQTIQDLLGADAKARSDTASQNATLNQQERNSMRSAGIDPDTGAPIPGGKLDPKANQKPNGGRGWATQTEQSTAKDEIDRLIGEARENKDAGEKRGDVADLLMTGIPKGSKPTYEEVPILDARGKDTGRTKQVRVLNDDGTPKTQDDPGFERAKSQLLLSAALDMAYDGHVSRRNAKLLHARGIPLAPLGLVSYEDWRKQQRANQRANSRSVGQRAPVAPDGNGQMRPT